MEGDLDSRASLNPIYMGHPQILKMSLVLESVAPVRMTGCLHRDPSTRKVRLSLGHQVEHGSSLVEPCPQVQV